MSEDYTHCIEIKRPKKYGWLWSFKHNDDNKIELMSHKRAYWSQYMQQPEKYKVEGALWTDELLNQHRVIGVKIEAERVAIGVDPSGDDGEENNGADPIGIVSACKGLDGHYYVLADKTDNGSPVQWATATIKEYNRLDADIIVGEKNYGGAMVKHTIRSVPGGKSVRYKDVTASRGKLLRAEPIVALYEQGLVHHVGNLYELEEELCSYNGKGKSPNRLDALVWALTELSKGLNSEQTAPSISLF